MFKYYWTEIKKCRSENNCLVNNCTTSGCYKQKIHKLNHIKDYDCIGMNCDNCLIYNSSKECFGDTKEITDIANKKLKYLLRVYKLKKILND